MINKRTETIDEIFDRAVAGAKSNKPSKSKKKKNKKNRLLASTIALILAGTAAISALTAGIVGFFSGNKKAKNVPTSNTSVVDTVDLEEMGTSLEFAEDNKMNQPVYGKTTGNVDASKIVTSTDSKGKTTYYKDQKAKDNAKNVGKVQTDTKNGTLKVEKDGTVVEKTPGYTVTNPKTNETIKGEGEKPVGYTEDPAFDGLIKEEESGKYVKLDKDLKDPETGEVLFAKGDVIEKTTLEKYNQYVTLYNTQNRNASSSKGAIQTSSTKEETSSKQVSNTETTTKEETSTVGKTNADGTYTFDGVTYKDYNTFLGLADNEDFALVNGVLWLKSDVDAMNNQKTK